MIRYNYLLLLMLFGLAACNSWLDVESDNQASDEKTFKDYTGFRSALNGVYYKLSEPEMYGRELSWGFLSVLAQTYEAGDVSQNDAYKAAVVYDYNSKDVKDVISKIWKGGYNAIANCNKLIAEIEAKDASFFPLGERERNLIYGEALALRGYLHLDLLRMFAPAPATGDNGAYIPYVTVYPTHYESALPTSEVLRLAKEDLLKAKELVTQNDTLNDEMAYANRFVAEDSGNRFFSFRGTRMNYLAVCGTLARLCLYAGENEEANRYALHVYELVEAKEDSWDIYFTSSSDLNVSGVNKYVKAYNDILFAFYNKKLTEDVEDFTEATGKPKMLLKNAGSLFGDRGDGDDYRQYLVDWTIDANRSQKWLDLGASENFLRVQYALIPALRFSEICYILAETTYGSAAGNAAAVKYLEEVRGGRGCKRNIPESVSASTFKEELIWEGMKEYLAEGQTFFMFKRLNHPVLSGSESVTLGNSFVLPLPDDEKVF